MQRNKVLGGLAAALVLVLASCGGPAVPRGTATLEGVVVDATTGGPLADATACFVFNGNVTNICDSTDRDGNFQLQLLPAGDHAVQVSKRGYTTAREAAQLADDATTSVRIALNPGLNSGELRIVLSWGENPRDLDSHLWVPQSSGDYEVYYADKGNCDAAPRACLDVDDTTSYGPETITIAQMQDGTYSYAVHWFAGTGSWAASEAVVRVYDVNGLAATYTAPNDTSLGEKSWWYVFDLDGTTITEKNTLSTSPPRTSAQASVQGK